MKARILLLSALVLFPMQNAYSAWNWSGTLKAKVQGDNRYTRYTDDFEIFGEVWGSFEAFDKQQGWQTAVDFVTRGSVNNGFEGDIYQLSIQKEFKEWNTSIQAGRFQRSDSLGFYSLDGASIIYRLPDYGLSFNLYGGRPTRQEDMRSVTGEWLYGIELMSHQQINWQNDVLPIDSWLFRFAFQQFNNQLIEDPYSFLYYEQEVSGEKEDATSTRVSMGTTIAGQFQHRYLHAYEIALTGTLETSTGVFEEVFTDLSLDITENTRVRVSYALYEPRSPYPTFKEQFYTDYYSGRQDLLLVSFNQALTDTFSYHLEGKRAARKEGKDIGYGGEVGVRSRYFRDWDLSADFDMLEFGDSSTYNLYFGSEYSLSAKTLLNLNLAYSLDTSPLYGENTAAGTELKVRYKLYSDVFIDLAGSYIANSRLDNEYRLGLQATWYFDNFMPKAGM
ncbi:MAG: hypothetical protein GQ582_00635 [Methyloprofundus sp.]|nr:hypothetical protein [Methyloprofundus sp.]